MLQIFLGVLLLLSGSADAKKVQTTHGPVEGIKQTLFNGKEVHAFLGVPFAEPPIGSYRFSSPQPLKPWTNILHVKTQPASCVQAATQEAKKVFFGLSESEESEDCLYLNVWRPVRESDKTLPVMIYIYGGGYFGGSANIPLYDGGLIAAEHDVIVASMNYRASIFGFMYLNHTEVPGNMALQDQIQAIKWIKDNAEFFGGDPNQITLFGESAGSISIALHLTNPETNDLFRYGIMESGTVDMPELTQPPEEMLSRTLNLADKVNCPTDDATKTLDCLRSKSVSELLKHVDRMLNYLRIPFVPIQNGKEAPLDPVRAAQNVPAERRKSIISGDIRNDFGYFIGNFFPGKTLSDDFYVSDEDWKGLLKNYCGLNDETLQNNLTEVYVDKQGLRQNLREQAAALIGDSVCLCAQIDYTTAWPTGSNKVYYYYFTHRPSRGVKATLPEWMGPSHGDDLAFVFGLPQNPSNNYTKSEEKLSKTMMAFWVNFAKTGNPNVPGSDMENWPELQPNGDLTYLVFNDKIETKTFLKDKECSFWNNVYPELLNRQKQLDIESGKAK